MKKLHLATLALLGLSAAMATAAELDNVPALRGLAVSGSGTVFQGVGVYDLPCDVRSGY